MNRINLVKYGFIRTPEEDFSDDGNRFQIYRVGNMRVSKLVADGDAYIAARYEGTLCPLSYEEYSKLPHYLDLDKLNGVSVSSINESDLIDLFNNCISYEKAYKEAADKVVMPTEAEIYTARKCILDKRKAELKEITDIISADPLILTRMSEYKVRNLISYLSSLVSYADEITFSKSIKSCANSRSSWTRDSIRPERIAYDLEPSFYYKECLEYLSK